MSLKSKRINHPYVGAFGHWFVSCIMSSPDVCPKCAECGTCVEARTVFSNPIPEYFGHNNANTGAQK